jgi:hypothetical protein
MTRDELKEQLKQNNEARAALLNAYVEEHAPLQAGDIVEWPVGNGVARGRIVRTKWSEGWITNDHWEYHVNRIRKDGSEGDRVVLKSWYHSVSKVGTQPALP